MRIGIDGGCLANRRGFGRFAREVLAALARMETGHEFVVFVDRPSLATAPVPRGFETVSVPVKRAPSRAASAEGRRSVGDMLAFSRAMARSGCDLVYFPASYSFVPVWGVRRVVVTLHDTLAIAHPELVFPGGKGSRLAWKAMRSDGGRRLGRPDRDDLRERRVATCSPGFRLPEDRVRQRVVAGPTPRSGRGRGRRGSRS